MESTFRFEKLEVWQKAIHFAREVYRLTNAFPSEERFGLTVQLRRAAVSISANLAEGSGRGSNRDFAHFVDQAYGSCMEVVSELALAADLGYATPDNVGNLRQQAAVIAAMLSGLKKHLLTP